jgi:hypothetical protein
MTLLGRDDGDNGLLAVILLQDCNTCSLADTRIGTVGAYQQPA